MRVLLVKMSSMGDVFHTFPALSDAQKAIPGLVIDWVVEKGFADIPTWHPVVDKVYGIELRKWRKSLHRKSTRQEIKDFFEKVNEADYDLVLDAQGLIKSVWVDRKIDAPIAGYDWKSVREPLASLFYQHKYAVAKEQHAILRLRQLFASALNYELADDAPIVYGLDTQAWQKPEQVSEQFADTPYLTFLHGTTWQTKYWPESHWIELLKKVTAQGYRVVLPWGNDEELQRAKRIATEVDKGLTWVPEQMLSLNVVARILRFSAAVVSVDTGLSHVAAALEVPMTVLYRVTDPELIGADGQAVTHLVSPLAPGYIKKFTQANQSEESLVNLSVDDVLQSLPI